MTFEGFAAQMAGEALAPFVYEPAPLGPHDVEIAISHSGICRRDLELLGDPSSPFPLMPGHEIVGTVIAAGDASVAPVGQRVGVGWLRSACFACEHCLAGREDLCAEAQATCVGHMGGYAQRIRSDGRCAFLLPAALESVAAAPLLCGGAAVFAALRRWAVGVDSEVGIVGVGALGHLALALVGALGARATALTSSVDKHEDCVRMGARRVASSVSSRDLRALRGQLDLVLCTVPARLDWITLLETVRPGGTLCLIGAVPNAIQLPPAQLLSGQRAICGSDHASPALVRETLAFAATHGIRPRVETLPLSQVNAALERVRDNRARYGIVLTS